MTDDTVPDTNAAFYVRETITDAGSDQAPYSSLYGPFSEAAANDRAAELEGAFAQREKNLSNPDGPAPVESTRKQNLEVVTVEAAEAQAATDLQPEAAAHVDSPTVVDATTGESAADEPAEPVVSEPTA